LNSIENIPNLSESYSFIIDSLKLNDKEIENYKNLYIQYQGDQLFGYPSYEHGNLQLECELHINNSPQKWYSSDTHFLIYAKSWTLLFEIHNMHYSNWDFGVVQSTHSGYGKKIFKRITLMMFGLIYR